LRLGRAPDSRGAGDHDEGLVIGAETVFAETKINESGRAALRLDEPRAAALLAKGFERPVGDHLIAKLRRACGLWSEGDKALAHIHLALAALPPCGPDEGLRIFATDHLIEMGVTPSALMEAQGFKPPALAKFDPDQPRDGSGRWSSGGVDVADGSDDNGRDRIARGRRLRGQETPKDAVEHGHGIPLAPQWARWSRLPRSTQINASMIRRMASLKTDA
jgi:hypothetical protein